MFLSWKHNFSSATFSLLQMKHRRPPHLLHQQYSLPLQPLPISFQQGFYHRRPPHLLHQQYSILRVGFLQRWKPEIVKIIQVQDEKPAIMLSVDIIFLNVCRERWQEVLFHLLNKLGPVQTSNFLSMCQIKCKSVLIRDFFLLIFFVIADGTSSASTPTPSTIFPSSSTTANHFSTGILPSSTATQQISAVETSRDIFSPKSSSQPGTTPSPSSPWLIASSSMSRDVSIGGPSSRGSSDSSGNFGLIIGIVVALLALLIAAVVAVVCQLRRKGKK